MQIYKWGCRDRGPKVMSVPLHLLFLLLTFFPVSTMRPEIALASRKEGAKWGTWEETGSPFWGCWVQVVFGDNWDSCIAGPLGCAWCVWSYGKVCTHLLWLQRRGTYLFLHDNIQKMCFVCTLTWMKGKIWNNFWGVIDIKHLHFFLLNNTLTPN